MQNKLLYIIALMSLVISFCTLKAGHEWGDDFASYIMQAESIVDGTTQEFIEHNSFTILESSFQIGPVAYPWGYPLILAPVYALKGSSPLALKLPSVFFFAGFLICLYFLWKESNLNSAERLLLVAVFAFNPVLIEFVDQVLSDIPFLFISTLALFLANNSPLRNISRYLVLGVVLAVAFFIRSAGFLLLASFLLVEFLRLWRNRTNPQVYRNGFQNILVVCGVFGVLWIFYTLVFPGGEESYFAQYQAFQLRTVLEFMGDYFGLFTQFFGEGGLWKYLYYMLCIFFLIGLWVRRNEDSIFITFFLLWMVLLITWPSWQGVRFIFPLFPIFIYFTFQGMKFVLDKLPVNYRRIGQLTVYGFWLVLTAIFLFHSSVTAYTNLQHDRSVDGAFDADSTEMYHYIREDTSSDSIIVFFKPRAMRLMTGHDAIMSVECDRLLRGDYIVLSRRTKIAENHQIPPEEIDACNLPILEVFRNRRFVVYEINRP